MLQQSGLGAAHVQRPAGSPSDVQSQGYSSASWQAESGVSLGWLAMKHTKIQHAQGSAALIRAACFTLLLQYYLSRGSGVECDT